MKMKWYYKKVGENIHVQVFSSSGARPNGILVFTMAEFEVLKHSDGHPTILLMKDEGGAAA